MNKTIIGLMVEWKEAVIHLEEVQDLLVRKERRVAVMAAVAAVAAAAVSIAEEAVAAAAAVEISNPRLSRCSDNNPCFIHHT
jgi:hypothetical protein